MVEKELEKGRTRRAATEARREQKKEKGNKKDAKKTHPSGKKKRVNPY